MNEHDITPSGAINSGKIFNEQRTPEGMHLFGNLNTNRKEDQHRLAQMRKNPDKYTIFENAYTPDREPLAGFVTIFIKD